MTTTNKKEIAPLTKTQRELFVKYYPTVAKIVNLMRAKLPSHADVDELHSAGVEGLADAITRLNPQMRKSFQAYISTRIRGAIIDQLRSLDYMSRSARNDAKQMESVRESLEQELGRTPSENEVRLKMGVSKKQFDKIRRRTSQFSFIPLNDSPSFSDIASPSLAETIPDENASNAATDMEKRELIENVRRNVARLPERQRRVVESYYFQEKKLGEIAQDFGLTEARICQIHSQALHALKPTLTN